MKPNDESLLYNLATLYSYTKELNKSIELFNKIIEINPSELKYYYGRGSRYYDIGDYERAKLDFQIILNRIYCTIYDEEEEVYHRRAVVLHFMLSKPETWYHRGRCHLKLVEYDEALNCFNNALTNDAIFSTVNDRTNHDIAVTYYKMKELDLSLESLRKCKFMVDMFTKPSKDCTPNKEFIIKSYKLFSDIYKGKGKKILYTRHYINYIFIRFLNWGFIEENSMKIPLLFAIFGLSMFVIFIFIKTI